jgi:hypothetical protein
MKLESSISRLATLGVGFLVSVSAFASTSAANSGVVRTLACELEDSTFHDVIDRNSESLDNSHVLFLLGGMDVMATVRDVAQPSTGDRKLTLTISYRGDMGEGIGHAETTYLMESAPLNTTLAEASIDLAPSERRYSIRCFLQ